jgi:hypothetical protein
MVRILGRGLSERYDSKTFRREITFMVAQRGVAECEGGWVS